MKITDTVLDSVRIESLISTYIREEILSGRDKDFDVDDNIFTSGLVDSIGIMRLIAHVEDELDVSVPPRDLVPSNFRTIRVMAAYLEQLTQP